VQVVVGVRQVHCWRVSRLSEIRKLAQPCGTIYLPCEIHCIYFSEVVGRTVGVDLSACSNHTPSVTTSLHQHPWANLERQCHTNKRNPCFVRVCCGHRAEGAVASTLHHSAVVISHFITLEMVLPVLALITWFWQSERYGRAARLSTDGQRLLIKFCNEFVICDSNRWS
jgi:hypothetical protein